MGPKKSKVKANSRNKSVKCWYYNRGYCSNGDDCEEKHPDKVCADEDCFEDNCENRHPNPCKFGSRCEFHRKKICLNSHDNPANQNDKRCEEVEKIVHVLQKENENLTKQLPSLAPAGNFVSFD